MPPLISEAFRSLDAKFESAVRTALPDDGSATVLYSGGVDSSLVADVARRVGTPDLVTVGQSGSTDEAAARSGAEWLQLPWRFVPVGVPEVRDALEVHGLANQTEPARSVLTSLAVALRATESATVLLGQGADELFGGYAHFRGLDGPGRERRRGSDWARLRDVDWPATLAIARRLGRDVRAPFLEPEFAAEVLRIPLSPDSADGLTKPTLRAWARERGIPPWLADRPKRAMQYGSGIAALVRRVSKATDGPA